MNISNGPVRPIPTDHDPAKTVCLQIDVPDDRVWIAALYDAIYQLTYWFAWDRDDAHTGAIIAKRWLKALDTLRYCDGKCLSCGPDGSNAGSALELGAFMGLVRQTGCKIETSNDGVNWCTLADFTSCIQSIGGTPDGGGVVGPGDCTEYDLTIRGNETVLLPVAVSDGTTITFSDAGGSWSDAPLGPWTCPDGTPFVLGACVGVRGHAGGDPSGSLFHGQLIMKIGATYYDASSGTVTVPGGTGTVSALLQANDSDISNNSGSVHVHVKICAAALAPDTWEHVFDFTTGQHGWDKVGAWFNYVAGTGFVAGDVAIDGGYERSAYIWLNAHILPGTYTYIEMRFSATFGLFTLGTPAASPEFIDVPAGTTRVTRTPVTGDVSLHTPLASLVNPATMTGKIFVDKEGSLADMTGIGAITAMVLRGTGAVDPYAAY